MATTTDTDIMMGGTVDSFISHIYSKLRSDIMLKFQGQLPPNWPRQFYETPFLFFFADFFRRICRLHNLHDRAVIMDKLEPIFSEIEEALRVTAYNLSQRRQEENREEVLAKERAVRTCREKIKDIALTQIAIKNGKADKYLSKREEVKQKYYLASVRDSPDAKLKRHSVTKENNTPRTDQTNVLVKQDIGKESQIICRSHEVQLKCSHHALRHQDITRGKGEPVDQFLPAKLRLSTGIPSLQRTRNQRVPKLRSQAEPIRTKMGHGPRQSSPLRNVQTID